MDVFIFPPTNTVPYFTLVLVSPQLLINYFHLLVGKCYEKADYFWLADKLIGGTTVTELRQGKDAQITDLNEVQTLPFGPLVHGHTSSSLYLTGVYSGGFSLAKFHKGCLADLTTCSSGYTLAFWVSVFDAKPVTTDKVILWLSEFGLQFFCK